MKRIIIVSDFDGTITDKDSLYTFVCKYAKGPWKEYEQLWLDNKIGSKECLINEFNLIPNLSENLMQDFAKHTELSKGFVEFLEYIKTLKNCDLEINKKIFECESVDFAVVSDGLDYFINSVFKSHGIKNINIISNHAEFINNKLVITFPNSSTNCEKNSGTCKCEAISQLRKVYDTVIYIGDGYSDFCVADKADLIFAKLKLLEYCNKKNIYSIEYNDFSDILSMIKPIDTCIKLQL